MSHEEKNLALNHIMKECSIIGKIASVLSPFVEGGMEMPEKQKDVEWTEILNYIFGGLMVVT